MTRRPDTAAVTAAVAILCLAATGGAADLKDAAYSACLEHPVEQIEVNDEIHFHHDCLDFAAVGPDDPFTALPPQVMEGAAGIWTFRDDATGATFLFMVVSIDEYSEAALTGFIEGTRDGFLNSARKAGQEAEVGAPVVEWSDDRREATLEAMIGPNPVVMRSLMNPGGIHDGGWIVTMQVVGYDLESARWLAGSLAMLTDEDEG